MRKTVEMKVCGMRDRENIQDVLKLRPDYMGFIFYDKTPRYVGKDFSLPDDFPSGTRRVGVFVNEEKDVIVETAVRFKLDFVQLHGLESVEQCGELKATGVGVIKVFSVDDETDFSITRPYQSVVDYFLFDTKGKFYGGNSRAFDWNVLLRYDQKVPFFLSGGITPENIDAIKAFPSFNIRAVDVNSGVEVRPAYKDVEKVRAVKRILEL